MRIIFNTQIHTRPNNYSNTDEQIASEFGISEEEVKNILEKNKSKFDGYYDE